MNKAKWGFFIPPFGTKPHCLEPHTADAAAPEPSLLPRQTELILKRVYKSDREQSYTTQSLVLVLAPYGEWRILKARSTLQIAFGIAVGQEGEGMRNSLWWRCSTSLKDSCLQQQQQDAPVCISCIYMGFYHIS